MIFARPRYGDLNVLGESGQKVDAPADGEITSAVAGQGPDVDLGQATVLMMRAIWSVSRALVSS